MNTFLRGSIIFIIAAISSRKFSIKALAKMKKICFSPYFSALFLLQWVQFKVIINLEKQGVVSALELFFFSKNAP